jgi:hypothetical protein
MAGAVSAPLDNMVRRSLVAVRTAASGSELTQRRKPPPANRRCRINQTRREEGHHEFSGVRLSMTGKGSIHKHGSSRSEIAGNLSAKFPGNAVNRSFNTLSSGQFLQACPEILVGAISIVQRALIGAIDSARMFTRLLPAQALRAHCLLPRKLPAAERT